VAAGQERRAWLTRLRLPLLIALVAILVATLSLGAWYTATQLHARDATIAALHQTVSQLTEANTAFQGQVSELTAQRDNLIAERDGVARERDQVTAQRDAVAAERDALRRERDGLTQERASLAGQVGELQGQLAGAQQQAGDLQRKVGDLEQALADKDRQLSQAREEGSRQQSQKENVANAAVVLATVVGLDNDIFDQMEAYIQHRNVMDLAAWNRNTSAYNAATGGAGEVMRRINALLQRRQELLAQLP
jgi:chromosome segregation ATPase